MADTDSILLSVRGFLGLKDVDAFDGQIIPLINSALRVLNQNGAGTSISIEGDWETWLDFKDPLNEPVIDVFDSCKLFIMFKVKQLFDPPAPNTAGYLQSNIDEHLWRIREAYNVPEVLRTNNTSEVYYGP